MEELPLISVVMATYNGARFLTEQLESIYGQTYRNIEIIVCDDQSSDGTPDILERFSRSHGLVYSINPTKLGVVQNFAKALTLAKGDYVALADQDDVWLPQKLSLSLKKLRTLEQDSSTNTPALVFSDLTVVDQELKHLHPSYWKYMKLNPDNVKLNRVLVENVVTGCTVLMNRATVQLAIPIAPEAMMHDAWLLMTASCFGKVDYLSTPTVLYRQHAANVVGARSMNLRSKFDSGVIKIRNNKFGLLNEEINQANAFYKRHRGKLECCAEQRNLLEQFISLKKMSFWKKKLILLRYSFFSNTFFKSLNVLLRA
ncbi:glycosyltransferase family 2 protein [Rufibacter immobilis]|uniref:Glycosyltransferase family 2 protein n=1 Tax=Rufibacter immobilis TaxID=1348778 RepID=A0A3M9MRA8_9BACT|nr:glycosyltransferase family 2 protein [Rufibacter immobilis]RNI28029.1 glycosyltransferase family 2 protein [Rufibacter immobilis]